MLTFFSRVETVNIALQKCQLRTHSAREMLDTLRGDLKVIREGFAEFWENTTAAADALGLETPVLPRLRKIPRRLENTVAPAHSFQTPDELYRHQYVHVIDSASASLDCRFSPSAFKHMQNVEEFVTGKCNCNNIMQFYQDGLDASRLTLHRDMCMDIAKQKGVCLATFQDVVDFLKGDSGENLRTLLPELTKLALTVPMLRVYELEERLGKAKFLSILHLCKGYWQVPVSPQAQKLTVFRAPTEMFQFQTMPSGLHGAAATFQCLMDDVLRGVENYAAAYIDDVVIHSSMWAEHLLHLSDVFQRICQAGLVVNAGKC
ncbi:hypothetical protein ACEWY4_024535 [Coilia grayii]|uniref:ribonuclease H n=1 Tax=Coilia grayii TaxID=363190 RepID=A0ABD1J0Z9_9TELE